MLSRRFNSCSSPSRNNRKSSSGFSAPADPQELKTLERHVSMWPLPWAQSADAPRGPQHLQPQQERTKLDLAAHATGPLDQSCTRYFALPSLLEVLRATWQATLMGHLLMADTLPRLAASQCDRLQTGCLQPIVAGCCCPRRPAQPPGSILNPINMTVHASTITLKKHT